MLIKKNPAEPNLTDESVFPLKISQTQIFSSLQVTAKKLNIICVFVQ